MKDTVVIALGNSLMSDEGIGPGVLAEMGALFQVESVDLGTNGFAALHAISGKRKAVFIDCAYMGETPGSLRRFTPADVVNASVSLRLSPHEGDLLKLLETAEKLGDAPEEVVIFGIQPAAVEPGLELSPALTSRMGEYVAAVRKELGGPDA